MLAQITADEDVSTPTVGATLTSSTDVERPSRGEVAAVESEGGIDFDPELASYGARLVGLVVDDLVLVASTIPGLALIMLGSTAAVLLGVVLVVAAFVLNMVWYGRGVSSTGKGVGNRVGGTTVVSATNGRHVTGGEAGLRYLLRTIISPILLIGFLMALGNSQRRTFHDGVAGTVVTRPPRASWSIDDEVSGD